MEVRITATYPATDGSMPESVEVICEGVGVDQAPGLMGPVLDRLLMAPAARYLSATDVGQMTEAAARLLDGAYTEPCRREKCGHPQASHMLRNDQGMITDIGPHGGACGICNDPVRCWSFVGKVRSKETT